MYSWWQLSEIGCAYQIRILPRGGVEAGRAPSCRPPDSLFSLNGLPQCRLRTVFQFPISYVRCYESSSLLTGSKSLFLAIVLRRRKHGCKAGTIGRLRVGTKQDLHENFPSAKATSVIPTSRLSRRSARLGYKEGSRSKQLGRGTYVTCAM